jgi:hypothetical protein
MSRQTRDDVLIVDANNIAARCWQARAVGASEPPPPGEVAATAYRMIQKQAEGLHVAPSGVSAGRQSSPATRPSAGRTIRASTKRSTSWTRNASGPGTSATSGRASRPTT